MLYVCCSWSALEVIGIESLSECIFNETLPPTSTWHSWHRVSRVCFRYSGRDVQEKTTWSGLTSSPTPKTHHKGIILERSSVQEILRVYPALALRCMYVWSNLFSIDLNIKGRTFWLSLTISWSEFFYWDQSILFFHLLKNLYRDDNQLLWKRHESKLFNTIVKKTMFNLFQPKDWKKKKEIECVTFNL